MDIEFCINLILGTSIISLVIFIILYGIYYIATLVYIIITIFNINTCDTYIFIFLISAFVVFIFLPYKCNIVINCKKNSCRFSLANMAEFIILIMAITYINLEIKCENANMIYNSLVLIIILISIRYSIIIIIFVFSCCILLLTKIVFIEPVFANIIANADVNIISNMNLNNLMNNHNNHNNYEII